MIYLFLIGENITIGSYYPLKSCKDPLYLVENYHLAIADEKEWVLHHKRETHDENGYIMRNFIKVSDLKTLGLYYNRPAKEFVFLPREEHDDLHRHRGYYFRMEWQKRKSKRISDALQYEMRKRKKSYTKPKKEKLVFINKTEIYMTKEAIREYCKKNLEELKKI